MKSPLTQSTGFIPQTHRLALAAVILLPITLGVLFVTTDETDLSGQTDTSSTNPTTRRPPRVSTDFWDSAVVPDPDEDPPVIAIRPEDLGVIAPTTPVAPQALIAKAIEENNLPAIQSAALTWFQQDPTAARDWLAAQSTLDDLQPAISYIAHRISENGDLPSAIKWANIITDPTTREDTLFGIQALALRNRQIKFDQIHTQGLSPDRIEELRSGAAGD